VRLKPYIRLARLLDRLACLILRIGERLSMLLALRYNIQRATRYLASSLWSWAYDADELFALRAIQDKQTVNTILRRVHLPAKGDVDGKAVTR